MAQFSQACKDKLQTCHPDLQRLFNEVIKHVDCTIIFGVRTAEEQKKLVAEGKSKTLDSKHLPQADGYSHAVDAAVYPINWADNNRNYMFAGYVKGVADSLGIKIRLGADWDGDWDLKDQVFNDLVHCELVTK